MRSDKEPNTHIVRTIAPKRDIMIIYGWISSTSVAISEIFYYYFYYVNVGCGPIEKNSLLA